MLPHTLFNPHKKATGGKGCHVHITDEETGPERPTACTEECTGPFALRVLILTWLFKYIKLVTKLGLEEGEEGPERANQGKGGSEGKFSAAGAQVCGELSLLGPH